MKSNSHAIKVLEELKLSHIKNLRRVNIAIKAIKRYDEAGGKNHSRQYRHQLRNKAKGLCNCGRMVNPGYKMCSICQKKHRDRYQKRRNDGRS
jgi:hypothetical protein